MVLQSGSPQEGIVGKHVFGNLYSCGNPRISEEDYLRALALEAATKAGMTIHDVHSWAFGGPKGGVSVVVLVTESHIAIHSWTEYDYATVDVFTCGGRSDPELAFRFILEELKPQYHSAFRADRSSLRPTGPRGSSVDPVLLTPEPLPRPRKRPRTA